MELKLCGLFSHLYQLITLIKCLECNTDNVVFGANLKKYDFDKQSI